MADPLSLPTTGEWSAIKFTRQPAQGIARNKQVGIVDVFEWSADTWLVEATITARTIEQADPWITFFMALNGVAGTFLMGDPYRVQPKGLAAGAPVIDGADQKGGQIATRSWPGSIDGILKDGDNIQIGTGASARLHRVLSDVNTDSDGKATLTVAPRVVAAHPDGTALSFSNPVGAFRMRKSNFASWNETKRRHTEGLRFLAESVIDAP